MGQMKTPGVYIVEKNAFPNSLVEVSTAVPAFIGYTEKALNGNKSLTNQPMRITSMSEYHNYFGFAPMPKFTLAKSAAPSEHSFVVSGDQYELNHDSGKNQMYYAMMMFYQNGGGPCYIVSVGNYADDIEGARLMAGIDQLVKEQEPTMLVIPEAILLAEDDCIAVQQAALAHCGGTMRNRIAILDVWNGYKPRQDPQGDCIDNFRSKLGINYLDFACA